MSNKVIGAIILLVVGILMVAGVYFLTPMIKDHQQATSSDAKGTKGTLTVAMDNWIGYAPLCSLEMKRLMKNSGYAWNCDDDKADYVKRMQAVKERKIQFAVGTVDTDVLTGEKHAYPGVIAAVIDQSKGGDGILALKSKYADLNALKSVNGLRIAFTPSSPSHHLLKAVADHFGIPEVLAKNAERIETEGSQYACKALLDGKVDVAVCWEPDISKTLEKGGGKIVKLLGTEQTERLIVDILMAERSFADANPDVVKLVLGNYFMALKSYRDNPELLKKETVDAHHLSADKVEAMLKGVQWATLQDNAEKWFGISANGVRGDEGLIATIESTWRILVASGDFKSNPLPSKDPYRLVNSEYVKELVTKGVSGFTVPGAKDAKAVVSGLEAKFAELPPARWANLRPVGTLRVEPVTFQRGSEELTLDGKESLDAIAEKLRHYPSFRILVSGHTALGGDPAANQQLSQDRADSVARYFSVTFNVDPNRMLALGKGSTEPLKECVANANTADCDYKLPRVEILLVRESL